MKQLMIPSVMEATLVQPSGEKRRVRFGQFECFMISHENGHSVNATRHAIVPTKPVISVTRSDGVEVVFDKPWYYQNDPIRPL